MHHPMEGGGVLCSAGPQQVKGVWGGEGGSGWVAEECGGGRGTGLVDIVERDAISPGRAPGTSQSTQRTDLRNTFAENNCPPKDKLQLTGGSGPLRGGESSTLVSHES